MLQVMIVEDEQDLLARFTDAVLSDERLRLAGAVSDGASALSLLRTAKPDVVLVDLGLPDISGIDLIRAIVRCVPNADVLVVTMFSDDEHVLSSIEAGATGYLLKDLPPQAIIRSIHEIHSGGSPISPTIARRILTRMHSPSAPLQHRTESSPLSERETDILRLVSKGLSFAEVGLQLDISAHTVVTHVKNIYRKLSVHSRGEAVFEASQRGLL
jgi:DNA-binding NarL/FixJ family response regulator